ncbi:MAG: hypothetical protein L0387_38635 [Acidobacteria bacterium]|nr:hypothetical protein [Acidobacteriota bacterium]MCI0721667.1 hypothetical protein [Acidobacteriota bacterium]
MPGQPHQSKLIPFRNVIGCLRREGRSYRQIAIILEQEHGIRTAPSTIHSFVKVRSKKPRKVYELFELADGLKKETAVAASRSSDSPRPSTLPAATETRPAKRKFNYTPSDRYNLTRISPEEKLALLKRLEEEGSS